MAYKDKEKEKEYFKKRYQEKKETIKAQKRDYSKTQMGRALNILSQYKIKDKKHNRGECTLTAKWIVDNIFTKSCVHCGESDWHKLGCNRLDNSKPHTPDNVEPCCKDCNDKLAKEWMSKPVYQYTLDNQLVKIWSSASDAGRNGYEQSNICSCCHNHFNVNNNIYKGYKWSYYPL